MLQEVETPPRARRNPQLGTPPSMPALVRKSCRIELSVAPTCRQPALTPACTSCAHPLALGGSVGTARRGDAAAAHVDDDQTPVRGPTTLKNQEKVSSCSLSVCAVEFSRLSCRLGVVRWWDCWYSALRSSCTACVALTMHGCVCCPQSSISLRCHREWGTRTLHTKSCPWLLCSLVTAELHCRALTSAMWLRGRGRGRGRGHAAAICRRFVCSWTNKCAADVSRTWPALSVATDTSSPLLPPPPPRRKSRTSRETTSA
jgi:hypothetical protein